MTGKFKILLLADSRAFHTERMTEQLQLQGCEVLVTSLEQGAMNHTSLKRKTPIKLLHYTLAAGQAGEIIEEYKPDVINAHYATGYGHLAALVLIKKRVPFVLNLWGSDILRAPQKSFLHNKKAKMALQKADFILADSQYLIDEARKIHSFDNFKVIPWGIEEKYLSFYKQNFKLNLPLKVIVPRPHEEVYGNFFLLEYLKDFINEDKIEITFPAWGSMKDAFIKEAEQKTGGKIKFYDKLPRYEYLEMFSKHHVYLSNARTDSSPVSLIEAMALGLLPVTADIEGVKEWLTDNGGFKYKVADSHQLKSIFEKLINADSNFNEIRERNRAFTIEHGIFEKNIAEHITILKQTAG